MTDTMPSRSTETRREGRLADPDVTLATDPRLHPRLREALAAFGLDGHAAPAPFGPDADPAAIAEFVGASDAAFEGLYAALPDEPLDPSVEVETTTEHVRAADGHEIPLYVSRPVGMAGPLPCVIYVHGGGMTILGADNQVHRRWARDLAATGLVVVRIGFRNAWTAEGVHPFPTGLDDCGVGLDWVHEHRADLGISSIVLQGESGGANLVIAMTLAARRDGRLDRIDGVFAAVPYTSGGYGWSEERKARELPSMLENDGHFIGCSMMDLLVAVYDPGRAHAEDPLAWPYFATEADVAGFPPQVVTVNELDPLRDEGIAYFRLLQRAGVPVVGRVNLGLTHGAELIFHRALAEIYAATVREIHGFASSWG